MDKRIIQLRHGLKKDFDRTKMLPAEIAVTTDSKEIFVAFAPGDCKKMATYEDMQEDIKQATGDIIGELTEDIDKAVQDAGEAIESANTASEAAGQAAEIANTASEEANQAAERAEAASKSIEDKLGKEDIIEGDNITIEKTEDGKIRINADGGGPNIQTKDGDTQDNVVTFTSCDHSDAEAEGMYTGFDPIESGESHSSIFEKISRAMNNVRAIIKMIGTTDITQMGDGTITGAISAIYPVGSIYMSVNNINPSELFGGTWVAWGAGRVPMGVDVDDTNFATAEKEGGNSSVDLSHAHTVNSHAHTTGSHTLTLEEIPSHAHAGLYDTANTQYYSKDGIVQKNTTANWWRGTHSSDGDRTLKTGASGGGKGHSHGNTGNAAPGTDTKLSNTSVLQPYVTCYMWKRTA